MSQKTILIIGSGISGLSAAFELLENNYQVQIFEARDIHGGRIGKNTTFANFPIELGAEEIHVDIQNIPYNLSVKDYFLEQNLNEKIWDFYRHFWGTENGTEIEKMSIREYLDFQKGFNSDHDKNYLIQNGSHLDFLEIKYAKVLPFIKYNTPIVRINYQNQQKVKIWDSQGNIYEGEKIILTVPISQLKNNSIKFEPELPLEKQKAIQNLQMGTGGCLVSGQIGLDMNNEQKREIILKNLYQKLGKVFNFKNIEDLLEDYLWIEYSQIKYIEGTYSYPVLNAENSRKILANEVNGNLFFAGEATHPVYFQTANGALDTGIREAHKIIQMDNILERQKEDFKNMVSL
ncbi:hypothetical protein IMG5_187370 [Ichthyophthirius multifiliis]|uniref:Amine oxidase domain-containing protein n=1 Tax=Ichthyophthirius multifiliis TaxID=5932 RepID=G0R3S6_ICHMU|nr:hypothetical protein IMG5_187370 [Ichthyophthirius multifiliis]EGR27893.1 hypothetical protein IMG5_187370 [Ichthyophthirius multifiliis]|eukprot:XP_004027238.1 hypothetical protein IMG5_187370 [Ichthyophthirius multifiliis]